MKQVSRVGTGLLALALVATPAFFPIVLLFLGLVKATYKVTAMFLSTAIAVFAMFVAILSLKG